MVIEYPYITHLDLTEQTYRFLKDRILKREINAGEKILVEEIARGLRVSRTPVVNALKMLESDGLVEILPRRGTFVTHLNARDVAELFEIRLADPEAVDTTLLIHPTLLPDFLDFNDFMQLAEEAVDEHGLDGVIQIASFHPHFQFEGTAPDDIGNFTNRAPFPTLHLLREVSIERAVAAYPEAETIYQRNIETLKALGHAGWDALWVALPK